MSAPRITLDDVASAAGVSRMTVSNSYSRPERVAAETRERVMAAAAELGYGGPSPVARTLRRGSTGVLGLLLNDALPYAFSDPGAGAFLRGLTVEAADADLALQILRATGPTARARVNDAAVDAFVTLALADDDPALLAAVERRVPVVCSGSPALPGVPCVTVDNVGACRRAAEHVVAQGYTRFAVVTWSLGTGVFRDRLQGWRRGLEAAGVDWSEVAVHERAGNNRAHGLQAGHRILDDVVGSEERYAVLAATDVLALGVLQAARERGVDVPARLGVVGFDDVEEAETAGLTTVAQNLFAQGQECARRASGLVTGPTRRHPTRLVVRRSTS
ncbi:LacI family DNA-binding transcriptional regulator [Motilibacter peucedani]|uniref:LacI family DNA-binding transcriptional regulator n=1 Tax=Motilibacter peucedani TaxID=598650 RepID=UPI0016015BB4|nr:LacI family DNA-binding transcriptional regulator [Motilibacter peucedani]